MVFIHDLPLNISDLVSHPTGNMEKNVLELTKKSHALFTADGRNALYEILRQLDLEKKDEIIIPAYTCRAVENTVRQCATPVFADVGLNAAMQIKTTKKAITVKTRAIVLVHPYGVSADASAFRSLCKKNGIILIEDLAQSLGGTHVGKPLGSFGDYAFCSFRFSKDISCYSGGCALGPKPFKKPHTTPSNSILRIRMTAALTLMRHAGTLSHRAFSKFTTPEKRQAFVQRPETLSILQKGLLSVQFNRLPDVIAARQRNAALYRKRLNRRFFAPTTESTSYRFPILSKKREKLYRYLLKKGIASEATYNYALYSTPTTDTLAKQTLCLPNHHRIYCETIAAIAEQVKSFEEENQ